MNKTYIFDADGTLIDSYVAIVNYLQEILGKYNLCYTNEEILDCLINHNSNYFIHEVCQKHNLNEDELMKEKKKQNENLSLITLKSNAKELLIQLEERNDKCFIYTHRGPTIKMVAKNLEIEGYFLEIIDASYGFKRKPDREGIDYIINKYNVDRNNTYYIGDRILDMECARNAEVKAVFYNSNHLTIPENLKDYEIDDLLEIMTI